MQPRTLAALTAASPSQAVLIEIGKLLLQHARKAIGRGEELAPILHLRGPSGDAMGPIGALFTLETEAMRAAVLREMLATLEASAFVLAAEAWTLPPQPKGALQEIFDGNRRMSEDDRRVSIFTLIGESDRGDRLMAIYRIREGKSRKLVEPAQSLVLIGPEETDQSIGGAVTGLLKRRVDA